MFIFGYSRFYNIPGRADKLSYRMLARYLVTKKDIHIVVYVYEYSCINVLKPLNMLIVRDLNDRWPGTTLKHIS